jgi:hypothetical protein
MLVLLGLFNASEYVYPFFPGAYLQPNWEWSLGMLILGAITLFWATKVKS